jgi:hypothetical protein
LNAAVICIVGLYRLCGSATKKRILREAFERNARTVDLSPDNVPDINVITGKEEIYIWIRFNDNQQYYISQVK